MKAPLFDPPLYIITIRTTWNLPENWYLGVGRRRRIFHNYFTQLRIIYVTDLTVSLSIKWTTSGANGVVPPRCRVNGCRAGCDTLSNYLDVRRWWNYLTLVRSRREQVRPKRCYLLTRHLFCLIWGINHSFNLGALKYDWK